MSRDDAETRVNAMMEGMRETLERDEREGRLAGLTVEDLADAMSHPRAPAVVQELMQLEAASVKPGDPAPDFSLPWLHGAPADGGARLTLSERWRERPVALVFGSYT